jgi:hypothetical protein
VEEIPQNPEKEQRALMGGAGFSPPPIKASETFDSIASSVAWNPG